MCKSISPSDVIDQKSTCSTSIISSSYRLKGFLTSGVPNLQFDIFLIDLDGTCSELNSDSQIVLLAESLVRELEQQAGFANTYSNRQLAIKLALTCVPNDDIFEQVCV